MDFLAQKLVVGTANVGSSYEIKMSGISEGDVFKIVNEVAIREEIFVGLEKITLDISGPQYVQI